MGLSIKHNFTKIGILSQKSGQYGSKNKTPELSSTYNLSKNIYAKFNKKEIGTVLLKNGRPSLSNGWEEG